MNNKGNGITKSRNKERSFILYFDKERRMHYGLANGNYKKIACKTSY